MAAFLGSASGKIIIGFFPPNSNDTWVKSSAAALAIIFPVETEPTTPTRLTSSCRTIASPQIASPVRTFTTPSGKISSQISAKRRLDNGACSEAFTMMVFPAARAAADFSAQKRKG